MNFPKTLWVKECGSKPSTSSCWVASKILKAGAPGVLPPCPWKVGKSLTGLRWEERQHNAPGPLFRGKLVCEHYVAPCKVIRIPKSWKFLRVESGILGIGIQNPAFGTQNPTKKWIQDPFLENPFPENPFQVVLTAFTRIHTTRSC